MGRTEFFSILKARKARIDDLTLPNLAGSTSIGVDDNGNVVEGSAVGGGGTWGTITGTLSSQTDLNNALGGKAASAHNHNLTDLLDTAIVTPLHNQSLIYNGTSWVNGEISTGTVNTSTLFLDDTASDIATYNVLAYSPNTTTNEQIDTITVNNNTVVGESYATATGGLGLTSIPAGLWEFHTFCSVDSTAGTTTITYTVYKRTAAGAETQLFSVTSNKLSNTSVAEIILSTVQNAFVVNTTDRLVIKISATTTRTQNVIVSYYHNGTHHYSHIATPMASHDLTLHLNNVSNPHSVTADQVLPTQTNNGSKYLSTNGSTASWQTVSASDNSLAGQKIWCDATTVTRTLDTHVYYAAADATEATNVANALTGRLCKWTDTGVTKKAFVKNAVVSDTNRVNIYLHGDAFTANATTSTFRVSRCERIKWLEWYIPGELTADASNAVGKIPTAPHGDAANTGNISMLSCDATLDVSGTTCSIILYNNGSAITGTIALGSAAVLRNQLFSTQAVAAGSKISMRITAATGTPQGITVNAYYHYENLWSAA